MPDVAVDATFKVQHSAVAHAYQLEVTLHAVDLIQLGLCHVQEFI